MRKLTTSIAIILAIGSFWNIVLPSSAQTADLECSVTNENLDSEKIGEFSYEDGYALIWQTGAGQPSTIDGREPEGQFIVICLESILLHNVDNREQFISEALLLAVEGRYKTRLAHPELTFLTEQSIGALQPNSEDQIVLVYDVGLNWDTTSLVLTDLAGTKLKIFLTEDELAPTDHEGSGEADEDESNSSGTEEEKEGEDSETAEKDLGITDWGQTGLVGVFPTDKWSITFDNYEIRYYIGDQSIVPQRGQFLVIWFTQSSQNGNPLPMGSFKLTAWADGSEERSVYSISREGTAALILTEYNWHPDFMSSGTPYRTGVVFDIRPEDTEFLLQFPIPNDPIRPDPINLRFTA